MNWRHLRATLWLRWRILVNRVRRTGKLSNVLFGVLLVLASIACVAIFVVALAIGLDELPGAKPMMLMLSWTGLAIGFLFFWMIGLLTDLQRSDAMSFKNLLHLPVSLGWIFLYNYLSSFVSLSIAIFLPAMLGLWLAMVIVEGPWMLLGLPLILGYFGMITALTYQLRGWLARMMENKRRGRNLVAGITVGFVLLLQIPNLVNLSGQSSNREERRRERAERMELRQAAREDGPDQAEAEAALARYFEAKAEEELELDHKLSLAAMIVPIGWLPIGMRMGSQGRWPIGLLFAAGLFAITAVSLRRSYRTTMAAIVGAGGSGAHAAPVTVAPSTPSDAPRKELLVQRELPFVHESTAGIACAGLRSLLRAPEAKMLLLSPVILLGMFGVMLLRNPNREMLGRFAPLMSLGATAMGLLCIVQLIQNQFGLDRAGFRAFVLSPVPRRRILLGKNLATAPLGIGVGLVAVLGLQLLVPSDLTHFLGAGFQLVSAYLLLCLLGNLVSIISPMRLKEHGLKAADAKWKTILWQIISVFVIPVVLSPLLIPVGLESFFSDAAWARSFPLYLTLQALALVATCLGYRWLVKRQGALLQEREQRILDVLTRA